MSFCAADPRASLVRGMLASVDCTTSDMLAGGYGALTGSSGMLATALTGLMTISIAIMGYRLMHGRMRMDVGELAIAALKMGLVLVLAGNWAVYGPLICRTAFEGPQQIADIIVSGVSGHASALPADRLDALQTVFDELQRNARSLAAHSGTQSPLLGGMPFAAMVMNGSAYLLLLSTLGVLLASRILLTFLLAVGPAIIGLLLFDATRTIVQGWGRALLGVAFAPLGVFVLLAIELSVIEPSLLVLAKERAADAIQMETAVAASIIVMVFAAATLAMLFCGFVIGKGLRLPSGRAGVATPVAMPAAERPVPATASQTRVDRIASAAESVRRDRPSASSVSRLRDSLSGQALRRDTSAMIITEGGTTAASSSHHRPRRQLLSARRR